VFRINRHGAISQNTYKLTATNLLTNGNFEDGTFTGYATTTNWTVVDATTSTPNGNGKYCAQAGTNVTSTLETNKISVTSSGAYMVRFNFGADASPKKTLWPNNLVLYIRFFDAGNNFLSHIQINNNRIPGSDNLYDVTKRFTVPASATKLSLRFINKHGGTGTLPDPTVLDDIRVIAVSAAATPPFIETIPMLNDEGTYGFKELKYTHSYRSGYKESSFTLLGKSEYLWNILRTSLGQHIEIYYDTECVFEGLLWEIEGSINGYAYSVSYDQLFNRIVVGYGDKGKKYVLQDIASIDRYGLKTLNDDKMEDNLYAAKARARSLLTLHSTPLPRIDSANKGSEDNSLSITCMGYMATLDWTDVPPRYVGVHDVSEAVADLDTGSGLSVLNAVSFRTPNDFISNDYSLVESVGTTAPVPERTAGKTSLDFINDLLDLGASGGKVIVSGLEKGRVFYTKSRPTTTDMYAVPSMDGQMDFRDNAGQEIPRPLVKSGIFVEYNAPVPDLRVYTDSILDPTAIFIKEIEYSAMDDTVRIITPNSDPLDVSLAKLFRRRR